MFSRFVFRCYSLLLLWGLGTSLVLTATENNRGISVAWTDDGSHEYLLRWIESGKGRHRFVNGMEFLIHPVKACATYFIDIRSFNEDLVPNESANATIHTRES
ncbi:hypothetical protein P879_03435 [Paragonimus westermani]|uniref:Fibronectin type-III domain-containing protein n=1 Tax=Paragonimus westermani TaxID=34504 RepID=A0A8T0DQ21_9TREM|nr:hypothetical protein P879_03435 [Paragonimus westermani]